MRYMHALLCMGRLSSVRVCGWKGAVASRALGASKGPGLAASAPAAMARSACHAIYLPATIAAFFLSQACSVSSSSAGARKLGACTPCQRSTQRARSTTHMPAQPCAGYRASTSSFTLKHVQR